MAKETLLGYNLIVIMERLSDPAYVQGLLRMFGVPQDSNVLFKSQQRKTYCFDESREWNAKYPAVIHNATVAYLTRLNALDIRLYNQLNDCPDGVQFPDFDPRHKFDTEHVRAV